MGDTKNYKKEWYKKNKDKVAMYNKQYYNSNVKVGNEKGKVIELQHGDDKYKILGEIQEGEASQEAETSAGPGKSEATQRFDVR